MIALPSIRRFGLAPAFDGGCPLHLGNANWVPAVEGQEGPEGAASSGPSNSGPTGARALRLVIAPAFNDTHYHDDVAHAGMRWTTENGWTGRCSADCWHATPEAALDCFNGHNQENSRA